LRQQHYTADVVERWIAGANVRRDLFHCIDIVAVRPGEIVGVQVTTASNLSSRLKKATALPELRAWLAAGGKFMLHGWARRAGHWHCRVIEVQSGDLAPLELLPLPSRRRGRGGKQKGLFDSLNPVAGREVP